MSGLYADIDGHGGAEAIKMAIADFGGTVNGKKIEFVVGRPPEQGRHRRHQGARMVRPQGVDMLIGGTNSGTAPGDGQGRGREEEAVHRDRRRRSAALTNEQCTPYTVHYAYDTMALAKGTGGAIVKQGGKTWFFLTADYAFGQSLEKDTTEVVKANGGTGARAASSTRCRASDFSSFLLQAQASKAQVLGLANAGGDTINSIKAANEFGITKTMKLAGLLVFINDIHTPGPEDDAGPVPAPTAGTGTRTTTARAWAKRYFDKMKKEPSMPAGRRLLGHDELPEGGQGGRHRRRRQGDGAAEEDEDQRLSTRRTATIRAGRPHDPRHVPDAGEDAGRVEAAVGLLQARGQDSGRPGVHHEGRVASARC